MLIMKKKVLKFIIVMLAVYVLAAVVSVPICTTSVRITEYSETVAGLQEETKLVCISDLHGKEYGDKNEKLVSKIAEQIPDAIFVLGDMINADADESEIEQFISLLERLEDIAPVYFSPGNHEMDYMLDTGTELMSLVNETGAVALCDEYVETEIGGNTLRIGGSLGHYHRYEWTDEQKQSPPDYAMEREIGSTEIPALVLLHMPESLVTDCAAEQWSGDVYFSGHTHGGVIRIPGIGGVFAPTQGFFPKYDCGQFCVYGKDIIITSGLAGYSWVPRVFNRPEICVVTLTPEI